MSNMLKGKDEKLFCCWVDHDFFMADHNYKVGSFTSSNLLPTESDDYLMFIKNKDFNNSVSPFQYRLLNNYLAEYNLELCRRKYFTNYPNRLSAIFLFDTETEAYKYKEINFDHVAGRCLRKTKSSGDYLYSRHDCSWIDFLRLDGVKDKETIHSATQCYWKGIKVEDCELKHWGKKWSNEPISEILYYGRIDFIK